MKMFDIFQIDAFAEKLFMGNPAAVCILDNWLEDHLMQKIAAENNLAETAFLMKQNHHIDIRWFTPTIEVDLCGHATLASAYVLFKYFIQGTKKIVFLSPRTGQLEVTKEKDLLFLDFPTDSYKKVQIPEKLINGFNKTPIEAFKGETDYLLVFESQKDIEDIIPDYSLISQVDARGVMVTSKGNEVDFVSRFFAPQSGINEDPVTGSAHTTLIPYWSKVLGKNELYASQLSQRSGNLICKNEGDRVKIGGKAILYSKGRIYLPD